MSRLIYFARGYFHPDYDADSPSELDVVRLFKRRENAAAALELQLEVEQLLSSCDESELKRMWIDEGDAYYEPDRDGLTYREWFEQVLGVLRGSD